MNLHKYHQRTAYAITQRIIISIYKGNLDNYKEGINQFVVMKTKIDLHEYNALYSRIEDAKIMDHLIKTSLLMPFLSDDEISRMNSAQPIKTINELLESYSTAVPAELQYVLVGQERLLLNVQNLLILRAGSKEQAHDKTENVSVGKKVWRALRNTLFDRICDNKNLSRMLANGSVIGAVAPLFKKPELPIWPISLPL